MHMALLHSVSCFSDLFQRPNAAPYVQMIPMRFQQPSLSTLGNTQLRESLSAFSWWQLLVDSAWGHIGHIIFSVRHSTPLGSALLGSSSKVTNHLHSQSPFEPARNRLRCHLFFDVAISETWNLSNLIRSPTLELRVLPFQAFPGLGSPAMPPDLRKATHLSFSPQSHPQPVFVRDF